MRPRRNGFLTVDEARATGATLKEMADRFIAGGMSPSDAGSCVFGAAVGLAMALGDWSAEEMGVIAAGVGRMLEEQRGKRRLPQ